jgi:hypothetical protein
MHGLVSRVMGAGSNLLASLIVLIAPWKNPATFVKRFVPLEG